MTFFDLPMVLFGWSIVVVLMMALWLVQGSIKNAGIVKLGEILCVMILVSLYSLNDYGYHLRKLMILLMVTVWGLRSMWVWFKTFFKTEEGVWYRSLRDKWQDESNFKFFLFFQGRGLVAMVLSLPFFFICYNDLPRIAIVEYLGVMVWLAGMIGKITAEHQLKKFRQNPANLNKVCNIGLWQKSRRPDFLGEWFMWVGYFLMAIDAPLGLVAMPVPGLIYRFLIAEEQSLPYYKAVLSRFIKK